MISRRTLILSYTIQEVIPVPNYKILDAVAPEKSWTKKKVYTHTNTITEKTKTTYPLYTSYGCKNDETKYKSRKN